VQQVDPALEVHLVAGDVVPANQVVQRRSRPPHRAGAQVPRLDVFHLGADRLDDPEALVSQHQKVVPLRRIAVERLVNLGVCRVDADLQRPHQHAPPVEDVVEPRFGKFGEMGAVFNARTDGERFHELRNQDRGYRGATPVSYSIPACSAASRMSPDRTRHTIVTAESRAAGRIGTAPHRS
jgi:hypothetical protein